MVKLRPISRKELVRRLRDFGYVGPVSGGRHQFMIRGTRRLILPNPHRKEISIDLLSHILSEAGISKEEWYNN